MDHRQNNGSVKAVSPRHCAATSAPHNCCFNCHARQRHKDNVRYTAVEEQPEVKEVQISEPSSTSLLMISSEIVLCWYECLFVVLAYVYALCVSGAVNVCFV